MLMMSRPGGPSTGISTTTCRSPLGGDSQEHVVYPVMRGARCIRAPQRVLRYGDLGPARPDAS